MSQKHGRSQTRSAAAALVRVLQATHGYFIYRQQQKEKSMTLIIYLVGWLVLIGGVSWALVAMHVSQHTIMIVAVIMLGIAIITGATRARNRDRS
jgi:uncharacterized membrane protein YoaK (UPF0700 family)